MNTIQLKIDYDQEFTINREYTMDKAIEMIWFPDNDLLIETKYETIVFNTNTFKPVVDGVYIITPSKADKNLEEIKNVDIKLFRNNVARYLVINNKFAYRLPKSVLEII